MRKMRPGEAEALSALIMREIPLPVAQKMMDEIYPAIETAVKLQITDEFYMFEKVRAPHEPANGR